MACIWTEWPGYGWLGLCYAGFDPTELRLHGLSAIWRFETAACDRHVQGRLDLTGFAALDCAEFGAENGTGLD